MKKITPLLCAIAVAVAGCASQPVPNYISGHYYMAGDKNCKRYRMLSDTRIMCQDEDGLDMGYRDAMTANDMQMYQYQQQAQAQQIESLNAQLQSTNAQLAARNAQMLNSAQQYSPPQVMPIQQPGGNVVRCISTDIYTNCRY